MFKKIMMGALVGFAALVGGCAAQPVDENVMEAEQAVIQSYYKINVSTRQIEDSMLIDDGPTLAYFQSLFPSHEFVLISEVTTACPDVDLGYYYDPNHDPICSDVPFE